MIWILTIAGALIGAAIGGWAGFFSMGFLGWLVGFIIKSNRQPPPTIAAKPVTPARERTFGSRRWNDGSRALEKQLARHGCCEGPALPDPEVAPTPEPIPEPIAANPSTGVAESSTRPTPVPSEPNFIVKWFTGGNTIVRVGLVILFVGLAFLVKYGVEHQLIPVELRVAAVAAAGIALLFLGWRLREKRAGYALSMQGAGVAVLYLTIFGSLRLYHLLPAGMAFVVPRGDRGAVGVPRDRTELAGARRLRRRGRLPRADPRVHGRRQPRDALQLLPGAERGHRRHRVVPFVARAERRGVPVHLPHRACVGRPLLRAVVVRKHRAVPRRVLPDVRDDRDPVRARAGGGEPLVRGRDDRLRRADRGLRAAGGIDEGLGVRARVLVSRGRRALHRARGDAGSRGAGALADAFRVVPRAGRRLRLARDPARARCALDAVPRGRSKVPPSCGSACGNIASSRWASASCCRSSRASRSSRRTGSCPRARRSPMRSSWAPCWCRSRDS